MRHPTACELGHALTLPTREQLVNSGAPGSIPGMQLQEPAAPAPVPQPELW